MKRLAERRPVTQGGRDHTSHRLVYYGLSEAKAVLLLALVAAAIGATALAYNVLDNGRLTAFGVLVTFVLLVQFGELPERPRGALAPRRARRPSASLWRALVFEPRRLVEVVVDFVVMCASFLAAYLLVIGGLGTEFERSVFLAALPILLALRYVVVRRAGRLPARVALRDRARRRPDRASAASARPSAAYLVLVALRADRVVPGDRGLRRRRAARHAPRRRLAAHAAAAARGAGAPTAPAARAPRRRRGGRAGARTGAARERTRRASSGSSTTTRACGGRRILGITVLGSARRGGARDRAARRGGGARHDPRCAAGAARRGRAGGGAGGYPVPHRSPQRRVLGRPEPVEATLT